nr:hypothetical protein P5652_08435 [Bacillus subtilis]
MLNRLLQNQSTREDVKEEEESEELAVPEKEVRAELVASEPEYQRRCERGRRVRRACCAGKGGSC